MAKQLGNKSIKKRGKMSMLIMLNGSKQCYLNT